MIVNCYEIFCVKILISSKETYTSHNVLIPYIIHNTLEPNVILDKRYIKFLWTLFNSGYAIL